MNDEQKYQLLWALQPHAGIRMTRLTPTEAELVVRFGAFEPSTKDDFCGRLTGPRCAYSTTVEVAYPWHQFRRVDGQFEGRVVIPDPAWWDVESPFLYSGFIEKGGWCGGRVELSCGLRHARAAGGSLTWNGRQLELRAVRTGDPAAARSAGFNVAAVPLAELNGALMAADRIGMLVVVEGGGTVEIDTLTHPSALGRLAESGGVTLFGNGGDIDLSVQAA